MLDVHANWKEMFPKDKLFYAQKTSTGHLQGMHARDKGRLDGPSVTLYENGKLAILGSYPGCVRDGAFRVWDESGQMLFYGQYKGGKKHGTVCLFNDGQPWLVQQWKSDELQGQTVVNPAIGSEKDAEQAMEATEETLRDSEVELRRNLHEWATDGIERVRQENVAFMKPAHAAIMKANSLAHKKAEAEASRRQNAIIEGPQPRHAPVAAFNRLLQFIGEQREGVKEVCHAQAYRAYRRDDAGVSPGGSACHADRSRGRAVVGRGGGGPWSLRPWVPRTELWWRGLLALCCAT
jgi:hypothetical protein